MIDIHSHIIPDVDDGAASFEESLEMLRIAEEDGIKAIVATPHVFSNLSRFENFNSLKDSFLKLKELSSQNNLKISIFFGAENYFDSCLKEKLISFPEILTINESAYFLLEFPSNLIFPGTREFIFNIINDGFIPIICHPERNDVFQENPALLYQFLQIGALSQINVRSLLGDFGVSSKIIAHKLLKLNMVHIIASDSHNSKSRSPVLSFAYKELRYLETEKIDILVRDTPGAIIDNAAPVDIGPMIDPGKKSSFLYFIRRILN